MNQELISYAYDFVSYLAGMSFWEKSALRRIILYGSAARGEAVKTSDIDLFIDAVGSDEKALEAKIRKAETLFYSSDRVKKWLLKDIKNRFSIIVGDLEAKKWEDLRDAISLYGITLWERFQAKPEKELKRYVIFSWVSKGSDKIAQVNLCRRLYGYSVAGKQYTGLLKKINGRKISSGVVIIPAEHSNQLRTLLRDSKMSYKIEEIFM